MKREFPWDFAFDCYFNRIERFNHIQDQKRGYVGDLKSNCKVWFKSGEMEAAEWAAGIAPDDRQRVDLVDRNQWSFTQMVRLPKVNHPVRLVILWDRKNSMKLVKLLVTNRVYWEIRRILNVYRKRSTGHGDLSPGRQATFGHGGLSATHRQGSDLAPEPGDAGAQSPNSPNGYAVRVTGFMVC